MASKLSVFDWHQHCSEQNLQPGGHGGEGGCIGLVKWKKYVVWRGSNDVMEMFTVSEGRLKRYADGEGVGKATLVAHGDKLLAVGGFEQGVHTTKVKRFTVNNEMKIHMCGSDILDMPVGCGQSCAISDGDNLVVMGGYDSSGSMLDKVQVYSNKTRTWSTGWALPSPCAGGSATLQYGTIILLGGNHMTTSVWYAKISDLLTAVQKGGSIWKSLPDVKNCMSSVCMVSGVLLAIGGQDLSSASKKTTSIYALYPIFQTWKYVGDMPFECSLVDSLVYEGDLVVVDGKSGRVVIGKVNDLHEQLKSQEQVMLDELKEKMSTMTGELETSKKKEQELQALRKKEAQLLKTTMKREEERRRKESELTTELTELKKKELEHKVALGTKKYGLEASLKNTAELRKKEKQAKQKISEMEKEIKVLMSSKARLKMEHETEVCKLKEQLEKSHCEWNAALVEKEEECKASWRKRESELETALEQERKEKETSRKRESELEIALEQERKERETSRKRERELEAALMKKEEELQASKRRESKLQAASEEKEREINALKTTLATDGHCIDVIEGELLNLKAKLKQLEELKRVQQEESPNTIAIHQESQEGSATDKTNPLDVKILPTDKAKVEGNLSQHLTVATMLGIPPLTIEDITTTSHGAAAYQREEVLRHWMNKEGPNATYRVLYDVLNELGERGAAEEIQRIAVAAAARKA